MKQVKTSSFNVFKKGIPLSQVASDLNICDLRLVLMRRSKFLELSGFRCLEHKRFGSDFGIGSV